MVVYLKRGADCLHVVQPMPLHPKSPSSLASFKSRLVLPFWYLLTQVVLEKRSLNGCSGSSSSVCVSKFVGEFFGSFYTVIVDVLCGATSSGVKVAWCHK